jgi:hypothetical protein
MAVETPNPAFGTFPIISLNYCPVHSPPLSAEAWSFVYTLHYLHDTVIKHKHKVTCFTCPPEYLLWILFHIEAYNILVH